MNLHNDILHDINSSIGASPLMVRDNTYCIDVV